MKKILVSGALADTFSLLSPVDIDKFFLGSSSEINPMIKPENFKAMIDQAHSIYNKGIL